ncbi:Gluconate dehydratase [Candidatus Rhodobacter oscarellae]|uniref:Gluconate dehydratase n=1 Tax=Candidatus Rhodobacter oscarellae TaxID=1675527 RepID=A0A0J9E6N5_9RHOB|nr:mandelate racemase/muconate lactonizing enzyme family protein [Candidatus Rhodobacter lobularis]KMW58321.1 Gluconate dehydratase [Candidatus Rhodobacter lobularis]
MSQLDAITSVDVFIVRIPREVPYLGPLKPGEAINERGYLIRKGNKTIYPDKDMTVLVRVTGESGNVGWGETYGITAPEATAAIIRDLLAPVIRGRCPSEVAAIWDDLYDMQRVRGYHSGYYVDALAAIDIALWDLFGRLTGLSVAQLLGGRRRDTIPAYISGLPRQTVAEKCQLAQDWQAQGYDGFKFAAAVSDAGIAQEMAALREALGPTARICTDLHWKFEASEAIRLIRQLEAHDLWFAEAPVAPEDIPGLARVAASVGVPIAAGEEWRTVYELRPRLEAQAVSILQPEMGHTGITQFARMATLAQSFHKQIIPHATISTGIFMAASLQASAAAANVVAHEYQHSVFDRNLGLLSGDMGCGEGAYRVPTGPGLGVAPNDKLLGMAEPA